MVTAVLGGLVNKELVAAINSRGGQAVGITGIDGNLLQGEIRDKEMGYVARIVRVNTAVLEALVGAGCVPMVAPLSMHAVGRADGSPLVLNVNGDTVAGELAAAIAAAKLIFLTDVAGIRDQSGEMISELSAPEAEALLKSGTVSGGMIPKVRACLRALERAGEARIIDGRAPHALLAEMAGQASGTTIKKAL
jgi:acetylglutamate kinase